MAGQEKACGTCKLTLPLDAFNKRRAKKDGYDSACRECVNRQRRAYRANNLEFVRAMENGYNEANREKRREWGRKWLQENREQCRERDRQRRSDPAVRAERSARRRDLLYGLAPGEYDRMVAEQGGLCLVCGEAPEKLVVDHCHTAGDVRGLLCFNCNSGLGMFKDDPARLLGAIAYLERVNAGTRRVPATGESS